MERISSGVFETNVNGVTTVYARTGLFSDGTPMTVEKCDGYDFIRVGFEYFQRVSPGDPIGSAPSFSDDTFDI
jgi:hypothetical protein